jgi:hypothetical protein
MTGTLGIPGAFFPCHPWEVAMYAAHVALTATAQADKAHAIRDAQTRKALNDARALLAKRRSFWRWIFR